MVGDQARPKKEYIATANFYNSFFTYTAIAPTSGNLTTTGKLTPVTGASTGNCPAGRILRELGPHLYPGVNPGLLPTDANYNVFATHGSHIFTKVYDAVTGLRGFIDANDKVFATYSNERPEEFVDAGEIDGTGSRRGPSLYGNTLNLATGTNASVGTATLVAGTVTVLTSAVTANSKIFLTRATQGVAAGHLALGAIVAGTSFIISSASGTDTGSVNWLIIN